MSPEELIAVFDGLIQKHGICLKINEIPKQIKSPCALDCEHDESGNFVGVGFSSDGVTVWYYSDLQLFRSLDFSFVSLICHNGRTDFDCLRSWGIYVKDNQLYWDTELMAHICDSSRHGSGLKTLAEKDLGIEYPSYDDIVGKRTLKQVKERKTLDQQPLELVSKYNAMDCLATYKLYQSQSRAVRPVGTTGNQYQLAETEYFEQIERPVAFCLQAMENRGICVDLRYLQILKSSLEEQKTPIELQIKNELGNINLNSPKQLLAALNAKEIYPTFKGKPSTDKRAFDKFKTEPIIEKLLQYSELETLCSTFVKPYLERAQRIVHPWFNQCGTRTGRLSCSNPNLLQIPKRTENGRIVRNMFMARPNMVLGEADYAAIEPRVLAHLSNDENLCSMFNSGLDFHEWTAKRLNISRDKAKVLNLSVGYRATKYSVQRQLGGTLEEAQQEIDKWWGLFPTLRRWQDSIIWDAKRSGFCTTLLGLRIKVDGLQDNNFWKREAAERQLINNITQGSAAELIKLAMIAIHKRNPYLGLLVQVYDSLLFESPNIEKDSRDVIEEMENCYPLAVPLVVNYKYGLNWGDCHD